VSISIDQKPPTKYTQGWGQRHQPTKPFPPGTVCGWLTVIGQLSPGSTYSVFECRCGERVTRMHAVVSKSLARGSIPSCSGCKRKPKRQAL